VKNKAPHKMVAALRPELRSLVAAAAAQGLRAALRAAASTATKKSSQEKK